MIELFGDEARWESIPKFQPAFRTDVARKDKVI
jgi:hypothetical protein